MLKRTLTLALLICALQVPALCAAQDDFTLSLRLVIGERSRDSHATKTLIRLEGNTLVYGRTDSGARANRRQPVHKEFKLEGGEISRLKDLIKEKNLHGSGSLNYTPAAGQYAYFEFTINVSLQGIIATQELSGPRTAVKIKEEPVYQKSIALLQELYRLINLRDKELRYQEPVN